MVNWGRSRRRVRAEGPLPNMMSRAKSSMAEYMVSSTVLFRRCISSMKRMSPFSRLVRMEARSPERARAGPEVMRILAAISRETIWARVVLPRPGGP